MTIFFVLLALGAVAVIALLAAGKIGQVNDPVVDRYHQDLPNAPLSCEDIADFRFGTAIRGYRMDDVDEALARLTETLRLREAQLAALTPQTDGSAMASTGGSSTNEAIPEVGQP